MIWIWRSLAHDTMRPEKSDDIFISSHIATKQDSILREN
jgi:hypothetical protein